MARHAIIDKDGVIVNIVEWAGAEWLPPRYHYVIECPVMNVGDFYDFKNRSFYKRLVPLDGKEVELPNPNFDSTL